jgi:hypothetical protein
MTGMNFVVPKAFGLGLGRVTQSLQWPWQHRSVLVHPATAETVFQFIV